MDGHKLTSSSVSEVALGSRRPELYWLENSRGLNPFKCLPSRCPQKEEDGDDHEGLDVVRVQAVQLSALAQKSGGRFPTGKYFTGGLACPAQKPRDRKLTLERMSHLVSVS